MTPNDYSLFTHRGTTGAIILKVAYGYNPNLRGSDSLVDLAEQAMVVFSALFDGDTWMVDIFPACMCFPLRLSDTSFTNSFTFFGFYE